MSKIITIKCTSVSSLYEQGTKKTCAVISDLPEQEGSRQVCCLSSGTAHAPSPSSRCSCLTFSLMKAARCIKVRAEVKAAVREISKDTISTIPVCLLNPAGIIWKVQKIRVSLNLEHTCILPFLQVLFDALLTSHACSFDSIPHLFNLSKLLSGKEEVCW